MSEVICDLPPELMAVLRELGKPAATVKECVVLELYRRSLLSSGKAAELLGIRAAGVHSLCRSTRDPLFAYDGK